MIDSGQIFYAAPPPRLFSAYGTLCSMLNHSLSDSSSPMIRIGPNRHVMGND
jgi:hypothetical protein